MEKTFDAVEMVRRIRDEQHDELSGRTWEERLAFYKEQAQRLHRRLRELSAEDREPKAR